MFFFLICSISIVICSAEYTSSGEPFLFTDETQIFNLTCRYYSNNTTENFYFTNYNLLNNKNAYISNDEIFCLWQFKAPQGYGFKIVVTYLNRNPYNELKVENSTDLFRTQHNVKPFYPYYNSDKYLKVSFKTFAKEEPEKEFDGYVTIVKTNWTESNANCTLRENGTLWVGSAFYLPNSKCTFELLIPPREEVIVKPQLNLEKNVDFVQYYLENEEQIVITDIFVLTGYTNQTSRKIVFEFVSDGSVSGLGFRLKFLFKRCNCSNFDIIVDCVQQPQLFVIANNSLISYDKNVINSPFENPYSGNDCRIVEYPHDDDYYCGNLACNYTINVNKECAEKLIFMDMSIIGQTDSSQSDIFRLSVNNSVLLDPKNLNDSCKVFYYGVFLSSINFNMFEVITAPSRNVSKLLQLSFEVIDAPVYEIEYTLTKSSPGYYLSIGSFNGTLVFIQLSQELILQNYVIDIYGDIDDVIFYENKTLIPFLTFNKCSSHQIYGKCISVKSNNVVTYRRSNRGRYSYLFFHASNRYRSNCVFGSSVINLDYLDHQNKSGFSAVANSKGSCKIYLFFEESIYFDIATSAKNSNVIVYGGVSEKVIFEFNKTTSSLWKDVFYLDIFLVMEIPRNSAFFLTITSHRTSPIINTYPYKIAILYPGAGILFNVSHSLSLYYRIQNYDVKISVEKFNVSKNHAICLVSENGTECLNNIGETFHIRADAAFAIVFNNTMSFISETWIPDVMLYLETITNSDFETTITYETITYPLSLNNDVITYFNVYLITFLLIIFC